MITPVVQVLGPVSSTATRCRLNLHENWAQTQVTPKNAQEPFTLQHMI